MGNTLSIKGRQLQIDSSNEAIKQMKGIQETAKGRQYESETISISSSRNALAIGFDKWVWVWVWDSD
ncbi:hypothetical protein LOK49_Contig138G00012 [Camellia lanceoleosa]|nr:hypothetical protein LOK49_Contig138G00012 [Camellia lanceoleosa]